MAIILASTGFTREKKVDLHYHMYSKMLTIGQITIHPVSPSQPVLQTETVNVPDDVTFTLLGKLTLPFAADECVAELTGSMKVKMLSDGDFQIMETSATAEIPVLKMAENITLTDGSLHLSTCAYKPHIRIKGTVTFHDGTNSAEGLLDEELLFNEGDSTEWGVHTLLRNARVSIACMSDMCNGTIIFAYSSKEDASPIIPKQFSDDDELLFQLSDCIDLKSVKIAPLPDNPLTLGFELVPEDGRTSYLRGTIFPARLTSRHFGEACVLFVHDAHYDQPFTMITSGNWSASISNNVQIVVQSTTDALPRQLFTCTVLVKGTLSGNGIHPPHLTLEADTMDGGTLFPESTMPLELPEQPLTITIDASGNIECSIFATTPLLIEGGTIRSCRKNENGIFLSITEAGYCIAEKVVIEASGTEIETRDLVLDWRGKR